MRHKVLTFLLITSGMLCWAQNGANKLTLRLKHLPTDAPTLELSKFVTNLMERDNNPLNYLPILNQLDSLTTLLTPYENLNSIGLGKFTTDLHTLSEAIEILQQPYDGNRIDAVIDSIDNLTFYTESQMLNQQVDSVFKSVKQYYGITTNLQELLSDVIAGQERYIVAATDEEKTEILKEIDENIMFDLRNERISRIPFMKSQLDTVFQSCPRDETGKLLPESFDVERLRRLYESNEQARSTKVREDSSTGKFKKKKK